jgi:hypothetical protein
MDVFEDVENDFGYLSVEKIYINMTPISKLASYDHEFWLTMPLLWANWELTWVDGDDNEVDANGGFQNSGKLWPNGNVNDIMIFASSEDISENNIKASLELSPRCPFNFLIFKYVFPFTFIGTSEECPYTFWGEEKSGYFSSLIPGAFFQPYIHIRSVDKTIPPTINEPDVWWVDPTPDIRVFFVDLCEWMPPSEGQPLCGIDDEDCIFCGPYDEPTFEDPGDID